MDPTIAANRAHWNASSAAYQSEHDAVIGAAPKLWGVHAIPESTLRALGDVGGLDVLELGCGAAQWAGSLAADGAHIVGLDLSDEQLRAARVRHTSLPLVQSAAQSLPFVDAAFDLVFCDHGAISWSDPYVSVPEAARVLRSGGRLVFNVTSPFIEMCWDDSVGGPSTRLRADYFGIHAYAEGDGATSYTLGYGDWIRLFRASGLTVLDLIEPRPGADAAPNTYWSCDPPDWHRRWPGESIWVTRRASHESPGQSPETTPT